MNTKITFVELVDLIAEATSTSKRMCELFLREFFNTVSQALIDGEDVKIKGIGTFKVAQVNSRKGSDGADDDGSQRSKITFTPDKALAEAINQPFAQFETVFLDDEVTDEKLDEIDRLYPSYFSETGELPEPPDIPTPPIPNADVIPALTPATAPLQGPKTKAEEPKPEKPEPKVEQEQKAEPKHEPAPKAEPEQKAEPKPEPIPKQKAVKPLMGIPIDGPSKQPATATPISKPAPKPVEEEEQEDYFYRPAPRNIYSPTKEQLETHHTSGKNLRWLWIALAVLATGLLIWGLTRCHGKADSQDLNETAVVAVADSDSIAAAERISCHCSIWKLKLMMSSARFIW